MEWTEARDRNVTRWRALLAGIGQFGQAKLLTRLNEVSEVCERAEEDAGEGGERCAHCLVFGSSKECLDTRWEITRAILDGDLDTARSLIRGVIARTLAARPRGDD